MRIVHSHGFLYCSLLALCRKGWQVLQTENWKVGQDRFALPQTYFYAGGLQPLEFTNTQLSHIVKEHSFESRNIIATFLNPSSEFSDNLKMSAKVAKVI